MEVQFPFFPSLLTFLFFLFMALKVGKRFMTHKQVPNLPPGPSRLPIIGSIHHLLGSLPHLSLWHLAKKHGPLMHLNIGQISTIVISSPEIAQEVLKIHDLNFSQRPEISSMQATTYGFTSVVFAPYGDYWRQIRKICILELLSAKRVQSFRRAREEEVSNFVLSISLLNKSMVDLSKMFASLTNSITSRAAFGNKCRDQERFLSAIKVLMEVGGGLTVADLFPSLKFLSVLSGTKFRLEKSHSTLDNIYDSIIKDHKEKKMNKDHMEGHEEEDLVDVLLRVQEHGNLEFPLTTDNIKAIILDMFAAGTETSTTVMEWAMTELMRNPRVMKKAQEEMREVLQGKEIITESDIDELSYLKLIIKETMRLHPPLPLLVPRESIERCTINGYEIPKKTRVLVNFWAISRDPRYWENPEEFDPDRFSHNSVDFKGQNFTYIPFGAGRRGCPGILFGLAIIELALANLLYHFDWKLPGEMKPEDLDMSETFGVTLPRKSSLNLIAIPHFANL